MKKRHSMAVYGWAILAIALSSVAVLAQLSAEKDVGPVPDRDTAQSDQNLEDMRPKPPTNLTVE